MSKSFEVTAGVSQVQCSQGSRGVGAEWAVEVGGRDCQGLPISLIFLLKTQEPGGAPRAHVAERDYISQPILQLAVVIRPSPSQWDASGVM